MWGKQANYDGKACDENWCKAGDIVRLDFYAESQTLEFYCNDNLVASTDKVNAEWHFAVGRNEGIMHLEIVDPDIVVTCEIVPLEEGSAGNSVRCVGLDGTVLAVLPALEQEANVEW